jgi:hypothetical protein
LHLVILFKSMAAAKVLSAKAGIFIHPACLPRQPALLICACCQC